MMKPPPIVYRVTKDEYADTTANALSGKGGLYESGRWHSSGQRVVYTAFESSGCLLERLVHGDEWIADRHPDRVMLFLKMPAVSSVHYDAAELAAREPGWQLEGSPLCRNLGDTWLEDGQYCVLIVPSAANPLTFNLLINPRHPHARQIEQANDPLVKKSLDLDNRVVSLAKHIRPASGSASKA